MKLQMRGSKVKKVGVRGRRGGRGKECLEGLEADSGEEVLAGGRATDLNEWITQNIKIQNKI